MNKPYGIAKKHIVGPGEERILSPEEYRDHLEIRNATDEQISTGNFMGLTVFEKEEIEGLTEEEIQELLDEEDRKTEDPTIQ
jgi:hypothetical protein